MIFHVLRADDVPSLIQVGNAIGLGAQPGHVDDIVRGHARVLNVHGGRCDIGAHRIARGFA